MSIQWSFVPNEEQEQVFCPHCGDLRDTPYFTSDAELGSGSCVVCLRCTKVLAKAYMMLGMEGW